METENPDYEVTKKFKGDFIPESIINHIVLPYPDDLYFLCTENGYTAYRSLEKIQKITLEESITDDGYACIDLSIKTGDLEHIGIQDLKITTRYESAEQFKQFQNWLDSYFLPIDNPGIKKSENGNPNVLPLSFYGAYLIYKR